MNVELRQMQNPDKGAKFPYSFSRLTVKWLLLTSEEGRARLLSARGSMGRKQP